MTKEHWSMLVKKLGEERGESKKVPIGSGFKDCRSFRAHGCLILTVKNCALYGKCKFYKARECKSD